MDRREKLRSHLSRGRYNLTHNYPLLPNVENRLNELLTTAYGYKPNEIGTPTTRNPRPG